MQSVVDVLNDKLAKMEAEKRFGGRAYPEGMDVFPFHLTGQGFYPGGDGLWRADGQLAHPSETKDPTNGVIFVGNDFGTLASYQKLRTKGYEDPPTWRNIKRRVVEAGIPVEKTFFTNATLGLRSSGTALDDIDWRTHPAFASMCAEFLSFQLQTLLPRLVVILGPRSKQTFQQLPLKSSLNVLFTSHPYPDHMRPATREQAVAELRSAWERASRSV